MFVNFVVLANGNVKKEWNLKKTPRCMTAGER